MPSHNLDLLNVALVGYGFAGKTFHAPVISAVPGMRLTHVVSSDAAKVRRDWPHAAVVSSIDDVCSNPSIALVVIATPNTSHFEIAQKSLAAGKHVVVDKPFTLTVADASNLLAQAAAAKLVLSVFQSRRWDGDFFTLRRLLDHGPLGEITHFESHYDRYRPDVKQRWRETPGPGSGIWFDLGPHLIDQVLQLFGLPEAIFADLASQRSGGVTVDYFHVLMRYGALRVILHGESFVSADLPRFIVHGTRGSFVKFGLDSQEEALKRGEKPGGPGWGSDSRPGTLYTWKDGALQSAEVPAASGNYVGFYEAVRDAILGRAPNPVSPQDALGVMTVLETGVRSSDERRELPFQMARLAAG
ncbi:MAG TPA: oxidoreductase [Verrucomicrobiae bacterium]|nr:oxidoreductase [Verrucomicrobiae bacterium]